jgi:hypothetical protein
MEKARDGWRKLEMDGESKTRVEKARDGLERARDR